MAAPTIVFRQNNNCEALLPRPVSLFSSLLFCSATKHEQQLFRVALSTLLSTILVIVSVVCTDTSHHHTHTRIAIPAEIKMGKKNFCWLCISVLRLAAIRNSYSRRIRLIHFVFSQFVLFFSLLLPVHASIKHVLCTQSDTVWQRQPHIPYFHTWTGCCCCRRCLRGT